LGELMVLAASQRVGHHVVAERSDVWHQRQRATTDAHHDQRPERELQSTGSSGRLRWQATDLLPPLGSTCRPRTAVELLLLRDRSKLHFLVGHRDLGRAVIIEGYVRTGYVVIQIHLAERGSASGLSLQRHRCWCRAPAWPVRSAGRLRRVELTIAHWRHTAQISG